MNLSFIIYNKLQPPALYRAKDDKISPREVLHGKGPETVSVAWHAYMARAMESDIVLRAADSVASVGSRLTADKPTKLRSSVSSGSALKDAPTLSERLCNQVGAYKA